MDLGLSCVVELLVSLLCSWLNLLLVPLSAEQLTFSLTGNGVQHCLLEHGQVGENPVWGRSRVASCKEKIVLFMENTLAEVVHSTSVCL